MSALCYTITRSWYIRKSAIIPQEQAFRGEFEVNVKKFGPLGLVDQPFNLAGGPHLLVGIVEV